MLRTVFINFVRSVSVAHTDIHDQLKLLKDRVLLLESELQNQKCNCEGAKMSKINDKNSNEGMMA